MLLRVYYNVLGIFLSVLIATGWVFHAFIWLETHVGGWAPAIAFVLLFSPLVLEPLIKGIRAGMREVEQPDREA